MKKILILIAIIFITTVDTLVAQDTAHLNLSTIYVQIDNNYPQLKYYEARIQSLRAMVAGAKAWMPPTVGAAFDQFPYRISMVKDQTVENQAGFMFSVQQMIPNPARLNAHKNYLSSLSTVQQNNLNWQKNFLYYTARVYYYRRYTGETKLKLLREYKELLNLLIKNAKEKYTYNQADLGTIFKAEAALSELNNMEYMLLSQIAEGSIGINTLLNREVNTPFTIDTFLVVKNYDTDYFIIRDTSLRFDSSVFKRSDILSVQNQIRSMELNRKYAATAAKPEFGVQYSHGQMFAMPNRFSLMGMVTIPIAPWSSKMYKSEVRSMGFEIEAMQREKETMQLMAGQMLREKITMLHYEKKQLDNYDKNVLPSYKKNLETNLLAYRQNTGNFFVLLDAWNMLLMKELERVDKLGQVFLIQSDYEYQRELR
ncbi:MAG: TolC family protein [Chitinophagales bacterium]|nr:TolC family protein [Chitinophagales bacterium]